MKFLGFDHIDTRVRSLRAVEGFYDELMPRLGLTRKRFAHVDAGGDWHDVSEERPYNTVEYAEESTGGPARFIGFIEDPKMQPVATRIAFRAERGSLPEWESILRSIGARHVELSADLEAYPAIFFEDACGTRLELHAP